MELALRLAGFTYYLEPAEVELYLGEKVCSLSQPSPFSYHPRFGSFGGRGENGLGCTRVQPKSRKGLADSRIHSQILRPVLGRMMRIPSAFASTGKKISETANSPFVGSFGFPQPFSVG
jgi:hypothetical protein